MKTCATCSMPLEDKKFIGARIDGKDFCVYCIDENKKVKSCEEIFEGGVQYFVTEEQYTREYAEKLTRKNMRMLPFWSNCESDCLNGEMLTDEEYKKLFINSK